MSADMKRQIFASCKSNHGSWNILQVLVHTLSKTHPASAPPFLLKVVCSVYEVTLKEESFPCPEFTFSKQFAPSFLNQTLMVVWIAWNLMIWSLYAHVLQKRTSVLLVKCVSTLLLILWVSIVTVGYDLI
jgi:hypothetical protein